MAVEPLRVIAFFVACADIVTKSPRCQFVDSRWLNESQKVKRVQKCRSTTRWNSLQVLTSEESTTFEGTMSTSRPELQAPPEIVGSNRYAFPSGVTLIDGRFGRSTTMTLPHKNTHQSQSCTQRWKMVISDYIYVQKALESRPFRRK